MRNVNGFKDFGDMISELIFLSITYSLQLIVTLRYKTKSFALQNLYCYLSFLFVNNQFILVLEKTTKIFYENTYFLSILMINPTGSCFSFVFY